MAKKFDANKNFFIKSDLGEREMKVKMFKGVLASSFKDSVAHAQAEGRMFVIDHMAPQAVWEEIRKMCIANAKALIENMTPNQFHGVATVDPQDNPKGFKYPELLDEALTEFLTELKQRMEDGATLSKATEDTARDSGNITTEDVLGDIDMLQKKHIEQDGKLEDGSSPSED